MTDEYNVFYQDYKNKLFSYLMFKCGDRETSKDIMQESFTRHFKHYGKDSVISPALLFTIARNALTDHLRNQKKFKIVDDFPVISSGDEERSFLVRKAAERVHHAMRRLPELDKEILTLAVDGVAYKEIASIVGLSEANIKVRIHRARTRLREMLNSEVD